MGKSDWQVPNRIAHNARTTADHGEFIFKKCDVKTNGITNMPRRDTLQGQLHPSANHQNRIKRTILKHDTITMIRSCPMAWGHATDQNGHLFII